jgi:transcriptional regulator with XRE-family HTH domain
MKKNQVCKECGKKSGVTKSDTQLVYLGLQEGMTINELAASLGCSRTMIYKIKNKEFHPEWLEELDDEAQEAHEIDEDNEL